EIDYRDRYRNDIRMLDGREEGDLYELSARLRKRSQSSSRAHLPEALFQAYTDMIESDVEESVAHELLDKLRENPALDLAAPLVLRAELMKLLEDEIKITGPLQVSAGSGRVVALVGPTGVGKTTTIAKLAANYRLRENI